MMNQRPPDSGGKSAARTAMKSGDGQSGAYGNNSTPGSLDFALLDSLFCNEIFLAGSSERAEEDFCDPEITAQEDEPYADPTTAAPQQHDYDHGDSDSILSESASEVCTMVEKALLQDFGVVGGSTTHTSPAPNQPSLMSTSMPSSLPSFNDEGSKSPPSLLAADSASMRAKTMMATSKASTMPAANPVARVVEQPFLSTRAQAQTPFRVENTASLEFVDPPISSVVEPEFKGTKSTNAPFHQNNYNIVNKPSTLDTWTHGTPSSSVAANQPHALPLASGAAKTTTTIPSIREQVVSASLPSSQTASVLSSAACTTEAPAALPSQPIEKQQQAQSSHLSPPPLPPQKQLQQQTQPPQQQQASDARQLVSQFESLASRLGLSLPYHVLQSLMTLASTREPASAQLPTATNTSVNDDTTNNNKTNANKATLPHPPPDSMAASAVPKTFAAAATNTAASLFATNTGGNKSSTTMTEVADQWKNTAEAAIQAVTQRLKRSLSSTSDAQDGNKKTSNDLHAESSTNRIDNNSMDQEPSESENHKMECHLAGAPSISSTAAHQEDTATDNNSSNNRRNKKRRRRGLAECQATLAQLQTENEILTRHVQCMTHKSHKFDQERQARQSHLKQLLDQYNQYPSSAVEQQLSDAIQEFSELHSDYGRHRHSELTFHLQQLQTLSNPTNFTKMGLWTLAQNTSPKRNPIAGILQKELSITPVQGRKIAQQRGNIQRVCANLKECWTLLGQLKELCTQKTRLFECRMNKCREFLSPVQVVKLLLWIDENSELLKQVCPGWESEQHLLSTSMPTTPKPPS